MTFDVSIIIVNWNTRDILRDCLRTVYAQTKEITVEVIVIDNAYTDGSAEMVKKEFPLAILIANVITAVLWRRSNHKESRVKKLSRINEWWYAVPVF